MSKINDHHREQVALVTSCTAIAYKQGTMIEVSQALIKKQQPEIGGLGVASLTDQNSGLSWAHVNTFYMKEVMSNV